MNVWKRALFLVSQIATLMVGSLQAGWTSSPLYVSPEGYWAESPLVISDHCGDAISLWCQSTDGTLQAAILPQGTTSWMSTTLGNQVGRVVHYALDVDSSGNALAVWVDAEHACIHSARLSKGSSTWVHAKDIPAPNALAVSKLSASLNDAGKAVVVWCQQHQDSYALEIYGALLNENALSWVPTSRLSNTPVPGVDYVAPQVGIDATGNAVAIWEKIEETSHTIQTAQLFATSTTWEPSFDLSLPGEVALDPCLACNQSGQAIAAWTNSTCRYIESALLQGHNWSSPEPLSSTGADEVAVAIDETGRVIAVWRLVRGATHYLQSSTYHHGTWQPVIGIESTGVGIADIEVGMDSSGNAVAVWQSTLPNCFEVIVSSTLTLNGEWTPVTQLSSGFSYDRMPQLSVSPKGAVAVWRYQQSIDLRIQSSQLEPESP